MIYYALKSQAEGRRELGAGRPNGPGTGRPKRGSVPPPSPCHPTASRAEPCRRATSPRTYPAPRHEAPSRRKMRFHRVMNLGTRRAARRDGFDTCGLLRVYLGGPGAARSGHVPGSCPSFACQDLHPLAKRGRPPPFFFSKNRDKDVISRDVHVSILDAFLFPSAHLS